jgi:hypothetical protein
MQNSPSIFLLILINWFLGSVWEPMSRGSASLVKIGGRADISAFPGRNLPVKNLLILDKA